MLKCMYIFKYKILESIHIEFYLYKVLIEKIFNFIKVHVYILSIQNIYIQKLIETDNRYQLIKIKVKVLIIYNLFKFFVKVIQF